MSAMPSPPYDTAPPQEAPISDAEWAAQLEASRGVIDAARKRWEAELAAQREATVVEELTGQADDGEPVKLFTPATDPAWQAMLADLEAMRIASASWPPCIRCREKSNPAQAIDGVCGPCLYAERAERQRIGVLLSSANIPRAFQWSHFDAPELAERVKDARAIAAARAWDGRGRLVLFGQTGCGKTSLASAIVHARIDTDKSITSVAFADAFELACARRNSRLGEEPEDVARATYADLAVIDDVGSEPKDPSQTVPGVLFERHKNEAPTIITTWASPSELASAYGAGISRRIFEGATVINFGGKR